MLSWHLPTAVVTHPRIHTLSHSHRECVCVCAGGFWPSVRVQEGWMSIRQHEEGGDKETRMDGGDEESHEELRTPLGVQGWRSKGDEKTRSQGDVEARIKESWRR